MVVGMGEVAARVVSVVEVTSVVVKSKLTGEVISVVVSVTGCLPSIVTRNGGPTVVVSGLSFSSGYGWGSGLRVVGSTVLGGRRSTILGGR